MAKNAIVHAQYDCAICSLTLSFFPPVLLVFFCLLCLSFFLSVFLSLCLSVFLSSCVFLSSFLSLSFGSDRYAVPAILLSRRRNRAEVGENKGRLATQRTHQSGRYSVTLSLSLCLSLSSLLSLSPFSALISLAALTAHYCLFLLFFSRQLLAVSCLSLFHMNKKNWVKGQCNPPFPLPPHSFCL